MKTGLPSNGNTRRGRSTNRPGAGSHVTGGGDDVILPWFNHSVCVFWLGPQCYGLQSALVGEVFMIEAFAPVPVAPTPVIGLFNLRGTPVALVDLAQVLELPGLQTPASAATDRGLLALVLRSGAITVGVHIRKMEVVVPAGQGLFHAPDPSAGEHPIVGGFLELPARPDLTITLLDPEELLGRLARLRYRDSDEDEGA